MLSLHIDNALLTNYPIKFFLQYYNIHSTKWTQAIGYLLVTIWILYCYCVYTLVKNIVIIRNLSSDQADGLSHFINYSLIYHS